MRVTVGALLEEASSGVSMWGGQLVRESEREATRAGETVQGGEGKRAQMRGDNWDGEN